jgi:hypothetical protein
MIQTLDGDVVVEPKHPIPVLTRATDLLVPLCRPTEDAHIRVEPLEPQLKLLTCIGMLRLKHRHLDFEPNFIRTACFKEARSKLARVGPYTITCIHLLWCEWVCLCVIYS